MYNKWFCYGYTKHSDTTIKFIFPRTGFHDNCKKIRHYMILQVRRFLKENPREIINGIVSSTNFQTHKTNMFVGYCDVISTLSMKGGNITQ